MPPSSSPAPTPGGAPVIGLTGSVAAGKSTVAALWAARGCSVIDVDALGHVALAAASEAVAAEFGDDVLGQDGSVDREALARIVFADAETLERLEAIVHPRVRTLLAERLAAACSDRSRAVVVDAALLFEGGLDRLCGTTVCIDAPVNLRELRAAASRGWPAGELQRRQARQLAPSEKRSRAAHTLVNDQDTSSLEARAAALLDELAPLTGAHRQGSAR